MQNEQSGRVKKNLFVRDLKEKEPVSSPFLIKFSSLVADKNGKPYMNLVLMDSSGEVEARIWDDVARYAGQAVKDTFVWVEGRCQSYQGRKQVVINKLQILREDEVEQKQYLPESFIDPDPLFEEVNKYVSSLTDPHYQALAQSVFCSDNDVIELIKRAPAAKSYHHAYKSGLLEHLVYVLRISDFIASQYKKNINRDLLIVGALLHDIGKLWELSYERVTDYTTQGKLIGHLVLGVELIDKKIRELEETKVIDKFPEEKKLLIKHLVLSHHGELEFGSPKRPKCLEAMVLHYVDDLDSKINSITNFITQDQTSGEWTTYNKSYERFFFKSSNFKKD